MNADTLASHALFFGRVGLLAGLWDFPAVPDVSASSSDAFEEHAKELVQTAFPHLNEPSPSSPSSSLSIQSVQSVGSVLHVFSHVKKTFQAVLVRLEDTEEEEVEGDLLPPTATVGSWMDDLRPETADDSKPKPAVKKRKTERKHDGEEGEDRLKWVLEANVAQEKYKKSLYDVRL